MTELGGAASFDYDVALSFAGEDRHYAVALAAKLTKKRIRVFYDAYEKAGLWGKNLSAHLGEVYSRRARFCVVFVSQKYVEKLWTTLEFRAALERALREKGREYILPVRIDNTPVPGLLETIGYIHIQEGIDTISELIVEKLGETARPTLSSDQVTRARRADEGALRDQLRRFVRNESSVLRILHETVAIEEYYQPLLLLRQVKRARQSRESTGEGMADVGSNRRQGLTLSDMNRWEEWLPEEEDTTYEPVALDDVFRSSLAAADQAASEVARFVVLGPPGGGKTTLTQYLEWRTVSGRFPYRDRDVLPARVRLREWEAWAASHENWCLPDYLAEYWRDLSGSPPSPSDWRDWLHAGDVLLLFDGLDEIEGNPSFVNAMRRELLSFCKCPTVVTCRTVTFGQYADAHPQLPVFVLSGLEKAQRDDCVRRFPTRDRARYCPERLVSLLDRDVQVQRLAANPLLLSIICHIVDQAGMIHLPATRTALYDSAITTLLGEHKRAMVVYPRPEPSWTEKRRILERAALHLLVDSDATQGLSFRESAVVDALADAARVEDIADPVGTARALRLDLTHNRHTPWWSHHGLLFRPSKHP
jgi:hypothetical protein